MKLKQRRYIEGDATHINQLYRRITKIDRSMEKFEWEWLNTWNGQGDMALLFEEGENGQEVLVAQYSLIPVPLSFFGRQVLAGKTENCMCNPDYRKKNIYISHEKESFEQAKERFSVFYTTAGRVSNWAIAKIRGKMGYTPLDSWSSYFFCLKRQSLMVFILSQLKKDTFSSTILRICVSIASYLFTFYGKLRLLLLNNGMAGEVQLENSAIIDKVVNLWEKNKSSYGVTIDRNRRYLKWRLLENPNYQYQFLTITKRGVLKGYIVFFIDKNNILHIEDVLVDKKSRKELGKLIKDLLYWAVSKNLSGIHCKILSGNGFLGRSLLKRGFINLRMYAFHEKISKTKKQFLVYLPPFFLNDERVKVRSNWYITNLASEGRE
ncbi:MAG: hypothetical protein V6Z89_05710 [Desulfobacter sp.]